MKKLPKRIYVAWQGEGKDAYLESTTNLDDNGMADYNDSVQVGIYELKEVKTAVNKTELV
jgi:hypothetical protein